MSRNTQAAVTSISQQPTVRYRLLVEVHSLSTGTTRACNGTNFLMFAGNTYSPIGHLGGAEKIEEDADIYPRALRLWFTAVPSMEIQDVLAENMFNKPVHMYRTFLTPSLTLVASAEMVFKGRVETADLKLGDEERGNFFEIEVESRLARAPVAMYFNQATLWTVYNASGDTFFDYVTQIPLTRVNWGGITNPRVPIIGGHPSENPDGSWTRPLPVDQRGGS